MTTPQRRLSIFSGHVYSFPDTSNSQSRDRAGAKIVIVVTSPSSKASSGAPAAAPSTTSAPATPQAATPAAIVRRSVNGTGHARPAPARKVTIVDHPIAQHALAGLRSRHTLPGELRELSSQLLVILALEATRNLPTRNESVETDSGLCPGKALSRPVVFVTVRPESHSLGQVIPKIIPEVLMGTISLNHSSGSQRLEPRLHLPGSPAFSDVRVLLFDPVVASGNSTGAAIDHLRRFGASDLALLSFVMSGPGLAAIETARPDLSIWTAAVDPRLDPKKGAIPGLGDFADRLYS